MNRGRGKLPIKDVVAKAITFILLAIGMPGPSRWDHVVSRLNSRVLHDCLDRAMRYVSYGLDCNFYDCKSKIVAHIAKQGGYPVSFVWDMIQANDYGPDTCPNSKPQESDIDSDPDPRAPWQKDMDFAISKGYIRNKQSGFIDPGLLTLITLLPFAILGIATFGAAFAFAVWLVANIVYAFGMWVARPVWYHIWGAPYGKSIFDMANPYYCTADLDGELDRQLPKQGCPECGMVVCCCHLPVYNCPEGWAGRPAQSIQAFMVCECDPDTDPDYLDIDLDSVAQVATPVCGCDLDIDFGNSMIYIKTPDGLADCFRESDLDYPDSPVCNITPADWDTIRYSLIHEFVRYRRGELLPL